MNTNDLKIFEAVAAHGSFTRAAELTNTVQSNVTARIKSLEDEFGMHLLTRTSRRVELTAAGKKLLQYSKQIGRLIEAAKQDITKADQVIGQLHIGCIETTVVLKIPGIINHFTDHYPDVELEFTAGLTSTMVNDVLNYRLDAAFVPAPIASPELAQRVVKEDRLVIVTAKKGPGLEALLARTPVKIIVFDQGCSFRARLESWLSSKGVTNYKCTILNTMEGIINFVEAGIGITILAEDVIRQFYPKRKLTTYPIHSEVGTMTTVLVYRKEEPMGKALKAFVEMY